MKLLIVFDIDGTLLDSTVRPSLQNCEPYKWSLDEWNKSLEENFLDEHLPLVNINKSLKELNLSQVLFTARRSVLMDKTCKNFMDIDWKRIYYNDSIEGEFANIGEYKRNRLAEIRKDYPDHKLIVFEDDVSAIEMFREENIFVFDSKFENKWLKEQMDDPFLNRHLSYDLIALSYIREAMEFYTFGYTLDELEE